MTKRDIVMKISKEMGLKQSIVNDIVQKTFESLTDEMSCGRAVEIRNFGVFEVLVRKEKKGRDPRRPWNEMIIPEHTAVKFRAGKELKQRVESLNS